MAAKGGKVGGGGRLAFTTVASTCTSSTVAHTACVHCWLRASLARSHSAASGAMRKIPSSLSPPRARRLEAISSSTRGMSKPLMRMSSQDSRGMPGEGEDGGYG